MFAYTHDAKTGGLLLNDSTPLTSKEPRPVYAPELDILGFDEHYKYDKQDDVPYMWAEANNYWYRGRVVARTKGGSLYTKPELELVLDESGNHALEIGATLHKVDMSLMLEKNRELLTVLEQITVKKIFGVYRRYKKKCDCFYVAFSGGKDSIVLLHLVKKALPKSSFVVIFGNTGMEFSDTLDVIDEVEKQCLDNDVEFYRAESHLKPSESWRLFGSPSRVLRWCCSVHKSTPQMLKRREILDKVDYTGMAYVGSKGHESASRDDYNYENFGKKQKGQFSCNAILDWCSAEVWLYIFLKNLIVNRACKIGNSRAGCLLCPMGGGKADYFRNCGYSNEISKFTDIIREIVDESKITDYDSYITNGGWEARRSGRDFKDSVLPYSEDFIGDDLHITVSKCSSSWHEWIKTVGDLPFLYEIGDFQSGCRLSMPAKHDKTPHAKLLKQVMYKTAYCVGCRTCEANCVEGCLSFNDKLHISDCTRCGACHTIPSGCYIADSMKKPVEGKRMTYNIFEEHAPKLDWLEDFFARQVEFLKENKLGPNQDAKFRRFLTDAGLIEKVKKDYETKPFADLITKIGWECSQAWGLILINLLYNNRQVRWYVENLPIGLTHDRASVIDALTSIGQSNKMASAIVSSFARLCELPLGTAANFGEFTEKPRKTENSPRHILTLTRTKATLEDNRVILYALYKFAEACEGYHQFTLTRLLDHSVESAGLSPTQIFGLGRDDMERFLNGLSAKYPEFINATFTHDLDKISLREEKTSEDVLSLF